MILRKPYAFFIKHFKLFHFILSGLVIYSIARATAVISFINQYLGEATAISNLISPDDVINHYSKIDTVVSIFTLLISLLLLAIMTMKKKKNKFYFFSSVLPIVVLILNRYGKSTLTELTTTWLSSTRLNALVDLYLFLIIGLIAQAAVSISRAVGFNISRFDFNSDLLKIKTDEKDNEEIGFVMDFDFNDLRRDIKKGVRYFKYFIKENKKNMLWCVAIFGVFTCAFLGYTHIKTQRKTVSRLLLKSTVLSDFTVEYNNSYIINTDSKGKKLKDNKTLVVLDLTVTNYGREDVYFPATILGVSVGEDTYGNTTRYSDEIKDLGTVYENPLVKRKDSARGLFAFEVPENMLMEQLYLGVLDLYTDKLVYLELYPEDLRVNDDEYVDVEKGEVISFDGNIFKDSTLSIDKIETSDYFQLSYDFYANKTRHYTSYEFMRADVARVNQDRCVMRIEGSFNTTNKNVKNLYNLFYNYGHIEYRIGDDLYQQNNGFTLLTPKKVKEENVYYIEVLDNIRQADSISLVFNIRGTTYTFTFGNSDVSHEKDNQKNGGNA